MHVQTLGAQMGQLRRDMYGDDAPIPIPPPIPIPHPIPPPTIPPPITLPTIPIPPPTSRTTNSTPAKALPTSRTTTKRAEEAPLEKPTTTENPPTTEKPPATKEEDEEEEETPAKEKSPVMTAKTKQEETAQPWPIQYGQFDSAHNVVLMQNHPVLAANVINQLNFSQHPRVQHLLTHLKQLKSQFKALAKAHSVKRAPTADNVWSDVLRFCKDLMDAAARAELYTRFRVRILSSSSAMTTTTTTEFETTDFVTPCWSKFRRLLSDMYEFTISSSASSKNQHPLHISRAKAPHSRTLILTCFKAIAQTIRQDCGGMNTVTGFCDEFEPKIRQEMHETHSSMGAVSSTAPPSSATTTATVTPSALVATGTGSTNSSVMNGDAVEPERKVFKKRGRPPSGPGLTARRSSSLQPPLPDSDGRTNGTHKRVKLSTGESALDYASDEPLAQVYRRASTTSTTTGSSTGVGNGSAQATSRKPSTSSDLSSSQQRTHASPRPSQQPPAKLKPALKPKRRTVVIVRELDRVTSPEPTWVGKSVDTGGGKSRVEMPRQNHVDRNELDEVRQSEQLQPSSTSVPTTTTATEMSGATRDGSEPAVVTQAARVTLSPAQRVDTPRKASQPVPSDTSMKKDEDVMTLDDEVSQESPPTRAGSHPPPSETVETELMRDRASTGSTGDASSPESRSRVQLLRDRIARERGRKQIRTLKFQPAPVKQVEHGDSGAGEQDMGVGEQSTAGGVEEEEKDLPVPFDFGEDSEQEEDERMSVDGDDGTEEEQEHVPTDIESADEEVQSPVPLDTHHQQQQHAEDEEEVPFPFTFADSDDEDDGN